MVWLEARVIWFLYLVCPVNILGIWWAFGSPILMDPNRICKRSRRIGARQREICANEPEIVKEVLIGTNASLEQCKYQFRNHLWNCHTEKRGIQKILKHDTREAAFVNAVVSSGIMYAITEACSMGDLLQCGCDSRVPKGKTDGTWEWGGCNDDVKYANKKTKRFMEVSPKAKRMDISLKLQLHNYEVGRLAIRKNMRKVCKCHGLSGSCNLKTCWIKMPPFHAVGQIIKEKYNNAVKVTMSNDRKTLMPVATKRKPGKRVRNSISVHDLVYTTDSPDYCTKDKHGSLGTKDRECDPNEKGTKGCDIMCCRRGYRTYKIRTHENCNCKFEWCCEVRCDTCEVIKEKHLCK